MFANNFDKFARSVSQLEGNYNWANCVCNE
jgi:hypothetical protein